MKILITGSSGHLGEALVRTLKDKDHQIVSADILPSEFTSHVGSITERAFVSRCMSGVEAVIHTATLHKPHVATHTRQQFVDTNITGTLNLLEEAHLSGVKAFVCTSTTSTFGDALTPPPGAAAAWITETVRPVPKNIYGTTKTAAEDLCRLFHRNNGLACIILKTSRFFPEEDDRKEVRQAFNDRNLKANELLYRRADIEDVVSAHLLALEKAPLIGFGSYIVSATTPFTADHLIELNKDAPAVVEQLFPSYKEIYARLGWKMFDRIERVYVNELARKELGWRPRYDFSYILSRLQEEKDIFSSMTHKIGIKGYHQSSFTEGPYPV